MAPVLPFDGPPPSVDFASPPVPPDDPPPPPLPQPEVTPPSHLTVEQPPPFLPVQPAGESQFASNRSSSKTLMYLGIGCGVLALLGVTAVILGIGWGVKRVGGIVSEIQANPEKFAAQMIVNADPNLELVKSDDAKGEITVRLRSTGELKTVTYKEAAEGKLTTPAPASMPAGGSPPSTTATSAWHGAPDWFPTMPGLTPGESGLTSSEGGRETIHLTATGNAPIDEIVAFFSDELDKLGFTITRQSQSAGPLVNERIEAADSAGGRQVTINVTRPQPDAASGVVISIESRAGQ